VPVRVVFRCSVCGVRPDPETQRSLERQLLDLRHGEYVDAGEGPPAPGLTWYGDPGRSGLLSGASAGSS